VESDLVRSGVGPGEVERRHGHTVRWQAETRRNDRSSW
jgi:hypothetical protein